MPAACMMLASVGLANIMHGAGVGLIAGSHVLAVHPLFTITFKHS